ncbi:hypothetical protein FNF31_00509 [Cafeteria roenbergensis]|uniref:PX domain-containing protein n=1 Tax=Cafeteria roenbergensis TaxID=33653 RepID=A0A5A8DVW1_CAFRO|nr:hypothetical protein FNF31_00509 [Cafeteria roenbergensis]
MDSLRQAFARIERPSGDTITMADARRLAVAKAAALQEEVDLVNRRIAQDLREVGIKWRADDYLDDQPQDGDEDGDADGDDGELGGSVTEAVERSRARQQAEARDRLREQRAEQSGKLARTAGKKPVTSSGDFPDGVPAEVMVDARAPGSAVHGVRRLLMTHEEREEDSAAMREEALDHWQGAAGGAGRIASGARKPRPLSADEESKANLSGVDISAFGDGLAALESGVSAARKTFKTLLGKLRTAFDKKGQAQLAVLRAEVEAAEARMVELQKKLGRTRRQGEALAAELQRQRTVAENTLKRLRAAVEACQEAEAAAREAKELRFVAEREAASAKADLTGSMAETARLEVMLKGAQGEAERLREMVAEAETSAAGRPGKEEWAASQLEAARNEARTQRLEDDLKEAAKARAELERTAVAERQEAALTKSRLEGRLKDLQDDLREARGRAEQAVTGGAGEVRKAKEAAELAAKEAKEAIARAEAAEGQTAKLALAQAEAAKAARDAAAAQEAAKAAEERAEAATQRALAAEERAELAGSRAQTAESKARSADEEAGRLRSRLGVSAAAAAEAEALREGLRTAEKEAAEAKARAAQAEALSSEATSAREEAAAELARAAERAAAETSRVSAALQAAEEAAAEAVRGQERAARRAEEAEAKAAAAEQRAQTAVAEARHEAEAKAAAEARAEQAEAAVSAAREQADAAAAAAAAATAASSATATTEDTSAGRSSAEPATDEAESRAAASQGGMTGAARSSAEFQARLVEIDELKASLAAAQAAEHASKDAAAKLESALAEAVAARGQAEDAAKEEERLRREAEAARRLDAEAAAARAEESAAAGRKEATAAVVAEAASLRAKLELAEEGAGALRAQLESAQAAERQAADRAAQAAAAATRAEDEAAALRDEAEAARAAEAAAKAAVDAVAAGSDGSGATGAAKALVRAQRAAASAAQAASSRAIAAAKRADQARADAEEATAALTAANDEARKLRARLSRVAADLRRAGEEAQAAAAERDAAEHEVKHWRREASAALAEAERLKIEVSINAAAVAEAAAARAALRDARHRLAAAQWAVSQERVAERRARAQSAFMGQQLAQAQEELQATLEALDASRERGAAREAMLADTAARSRALVSRLKDMLVTSMTSAVHADARVRALEQASGGWEDGPPQGVRGTQLVVVGDTPRSPVRAESRNSRTWRALHAVAEAEAAAIPMGATVPRVGSSRAGGRAAEALVAASPSRPLSRTAPAGAVASLGADAALSGRRPSSAASAAGMSSAAAPWGDAQPEPGAGGSATATSRGELDQQPAARRRAHAAGASSSARALRFGDDGFDAPGAVLPVDEPAAACRPSDGERSQGAGGRIPSSPLRVPAPGDGSSDGGPRSPAETLERTPARQTGLGGRGRDANAGAPSARALRSGRRPSPHLSTHSLATSEGAARYGPAGYRSSSAQPVFASGSRRARETGLRDGRALSASLRSNPDVTSDNAASEAFVDELFAGASMALSEAGLLDRPAGFPAPATDDHAMRGRSMDDLPSHRLRTGNSSTGRPTAASMSGVLHGAGAGRVSADHLAPPGLGFSPHSRPQQGADQRWAGGSLDALPTSASPSIQGAMGSSSFTAGATAARSGSMAAGMERRASNVAALGPRASVSKAYAVLGMQMPSPKVVQAPDQTDAQIRASLGIERRSPRSGPVDSRHSPKGPRSPEASRPSAPLVHPHVRAWGSAAKSALGRPSSASWAGSGGAGRSPHAASTPRMSSDVASRFASLSSVPEAEGPEGAAAAEAADAAAAAAAAAAGGFSERQQPVDAPPQPVIASSHSPRSSGHAPVGRPGDSWRHHRQSASSALDGATRAGRLPGGRASVAASELPPSRDYGASPDTASPAPGSSMSWRHGAVPGVPRSASAAPVLGVSAAGATLPRWSMGGDSSSRGDGSGGDHEAGAASQRVSDAAGAGHAVARAVDAALGGLPAHRGGQPSLRRQAAPPEEPDLPLSSPIGVQIVDVGWRATGTGTSGHVVFLLEVTTGVRAWHLQRRFSEFAALHRCLEAAVAADAAIASRIELPRFPSREVVRTAVQGAAALGHERKSLLQAYLNSVVRRPELWAACDELVFFLDDRRRTLSLQVALRRLLRTLGAVTDVLEQATEAWEEVQAAKRAGRSANLDAHDEETMQQRVVAADKERTRILVRVKAVSEAIAAQALVTLGGPARHAVPPPADGGKQHSSGSAAAAAAAAGGGSAAPAPAAASAKGKSSAGKGGAGQDDASAGAEAAPDAEGASKTASPSRPKGATAAALELRSDQTAGGWGAKTDSGAASGHSGGGGGASLANASVALRRAVLTVERQALVAAGRSAEGTSAVLSPETLRDISASARLLVRTARHLALRCGMDAPAAGAAAGPAEESSAPNGAKRLSDRSNGAVPSAASAQHAAAAASAAAAAAAPAGSVPGSGSGGDLPERQKQRQLLNELLRMDGASSRMGPGSPFRQLLDASDELASALVTTGAARARRAEIMLLTRRLVRDAIGCEAAATASSASLTYGPSSPIEMTAVVPSTSSLSSAWFTSLTEYTARVAATHQRVARSVAREEHRAQRRVAAERASERMAGRLSVPVEGSEGDSDDGAPTPKPARQAPSLANMGAQPRTYASGVPSYLMGPDEPRQGRSAAAPHRPRGAIGKDSKLAGAGAPSGEHDSQLALLALQRAAVRRKETPQDLLARAPLSRSDAPDGDGDESAAPSLATSADDRPDVTWESGRDGPPGGAFASRQALTAGVAAASEASSGSVGLGMGSRSKRPSLRSERGSYSSRGGGMYDGDGSSSAGGGFDAGARLGARSIDSDGLAGFGLDAASSTATSGAGDGAAADIGSLPGWMFARDGHLMLIRNAGFVPEVSLRLAGEPDGEGETPREGEAAAGRSGGRSPSAGSLRSRGSAGSRWRRSQRRSLGSSPDLSVLATAEDAILAAVTGPVVRWRVDNTLVELRANDWHGVAMARWVEHMDRQTDSAVMALWEAKASEARMGATINAKKRAAEARAAARREGRDPAAAAAAVLSGADADEYLPGLPPRPQAHLLKRSFVLLRSWLEIDTRGLEEDGTPAPSAAQPSPPDQPERRPRRGPMLGAQATCVPHDVLAVMIAGILAESMQQVRDDEEARQERRRSTSFSAGGGGDKRPAAQAVPRRVGGLGLLTHPLQVVAAVATRFGRGLAAALLTGSAVVTADGPVDLGTYRAWLRGTPVARQPPDVDAWSAHLREFSAGCDLAERRARQAAQAASDGLAPRAVLPTGVGVPTAAQPRDGLVPDDLLRDALDAFRPPPPPPPGADPNEDATLLVVSPVAPWRNLSAAASPLLATSFLLCLRGAARRIVLGLERAEARHTAQTASAPDLGEPPASDDPVVAAGSGDADSVASPSVPPTASPGVSSAGASPALNASAVASKALSPASTGDSPPPSPGILPRLDADATSARAGGGSRLARHSSASSMSAGARRDLARSLFGPRLVESTPLDETRRPDLRTHPLQRRAAVAFETFSPSASTCPRPDVPDDADDIAPADKRPRPAPVKDLPLLALTGIHRDGRSLHPLTHIPQFPADHPFHAYRSAALEAREAESMLDQMRASGEPIADDGSAVTAVFGGRTAAALSLIRQVKVRVAAMPPTPLPASLLDPQCRSALHDDSPDFITLTVAQAIAATMMRGPRSALTHPVFGDGLRASAEEALRTDADEPGAGPSKGRSSRSRRRPAQATKGRAAVLNPEADWWRTHEDAAGVGVRLFLLSHASAIDALSKGVALPTPSPLPARPLQATDSLIDSDIDMLWTVMTGRLTVGGIISILYRELRWTGHLSIAQLGKALRTASGWSHLPDKVKDRLGGLKRFITRFPAAFHVGFNHPFNPQVCLRDSVGVFLWISMEPDEATAVGLAKVTSKKKSRGKGKNKGHAGAADAGSVHTGSGFAGGRDTPSSRDTSADHGPPQRYAGPDSAAGRFGFAEYRGGRPEAAHAAAPPHSPAYGASQPAYGFASAVYSVPHSAAYGASDVIVVPSPDDVPAGPTSNLPPAPPGSVYLYTADGTPLLVSAAALTALATGQRPG